MVIVRIEFVDAEAITASVAQLTDIQAVVKAAIQTASWPDRVLRGIKIDVPAEVTIIEMTEIQFEIAYLLDPGQWDDLRFEARMELLERITFTHG